MDNGAGVILQSAIERCRAFTAKDTDPRLPSRIGSGLNGTLNEVTGVHASSDAHQTLDSSTVFQIVVKGSRLLTPNKRALPGPLFVTRFNWLQVLQDSK